MSSHVFSVTVAEMDGVLRKDFSIIQVDVDGDKKVGGMLPSAERKLLEYHQAKGAVYPLIQVPSSPHVNTKDGTRSDPLFEAAFPVALMGAIVITCYESSQLKLYWNQYFRLLSMFGLHVEKDPKVEKGKTIDALSWHPYLNRVTCLKFQPFAGCTLAVGCREGICMWKLEPTVDPVNALPQASSVNVAERSADSAWMSFLRLSGFRLVTSISWSPCGRYLAAGYESRDKAVVWDAVSGLSSQLESFTPLSVLGTYGGGVREVCWSPDGNLLLVALRTQLFALYETRSWSWHRHRTSGSLVAACFSPNSRYLLVASNSDGEGKIEVFNKEQGMVPTSILSMSWNRSGERLAITLAGTRDNPEQKHHLGLYLTECDGRSNHVRLVFRGFIKGPPELQRHEPSDEPGKLDDPLPTLTEFRPSFRSSMDHQNQPRSEGALLTVGWSNGRISSYPLYFPSLIGHLNAPIDPP
ncbi:hypothetical protein GUITHDRAFT_139787 [Guillardia theta CCMP2712]|uniref:Uncharacterized protein n=1 Tax=Guillardia theta (strain CCMP2712) TaxID=905079 RepID=L1J7P6_GUITC|nr:hypothetical protein GUITHDRAFT_139787 [Guillardia theta CCMP2712]EKX44563.1 hypothetical protein GUITHDRAFT_139787 [Guillardia theta CCMP2712]|eukprot:XP_005831543.1 hypothetical protein GUITHDRAFT_139787 [Guillardia theta CCMP2712]